MYHLTKRLQLQGDLDLLVAFLEF